MSNNLLSRSGQVLEQEHIDKLKGSTVAIFGCGSVRILYGR